MELGLAGKAVVVTGGSRGIGLETARLFAREGAHVLICARRESALAEAAADVRSSPGSTIRTHPMDVTDLAHIAALPDVKWEREMAKRPLGPEEADRVRQEWSARQGMRDTRWGTPQELANTIVFAASDAASYVNGAVLVVDGAQDKS